MDLLDTVLIGVGVLGADSIAERKQDVEDIVGAPYLVIGGVAEEVVLTCGVEVGEL